MASPRIAWTMLLAQLCLLFSIVHAVPTPHDLDIVPRQASTAASNYWPANIKRQGLVAFGKSTDYKVYRNVKDYGAKGMDPSHVTLSTGHILMHIR